MKIGITTSLFNACDNHVFQAFPQLANLGFDYIELVSRDPKSVKIKRLSDLLRDHGSGVYAVSAWCNYSYQNPAHPNKYVRQTYVRYLTDLIDLAAALGSKIVVTSAGLIEGISREEAVEYCAESLREVADYSCAAGVKVGIEAVSRFVSNFINSVDHVLSLIKIIDNSSIGITLDTFHMNIEEASYEKSIRKVGERLFHIHLADNNRYAPGLGHIDFQTIVNTLKAIEYHGNLSLEIQGRDDPAKEAKSGFEFMQRIVNC
jgi:sugar phosphate isomerase/epimerase